VFGEVVVVFMPGEADRLAELRAAEVPHLVIVGTNSEPPVVVCDCEEWIRFPAGASDVSARLEGLRQRAARRGLPRPVLTQDGLLRASNSWVALSRTEQRVAQRLLASFEELVPTAVIAEALRTDKSTRVTTCVARLRRRIEPLGLTIGSVRSRGYFMTYAPAA
jgi:two-component system, OmpR family, response regulator